MDNPVLVEVLRGGVCESRHAGALSIVDADGAVVAALGDIERPVFARSAVKLLQALPLVESGAAASLGLNDEELALACASHSGEDAHVRTARGMLAKAGLSEHALECGAHWPYDEQAARVLAATGNTPCTVHNNCSGKHAGFLCLARRLMPDAADACEWVRGYVQPEHPVMLEVSGSLAETTGCDLAKAPRGIDGCSIPAFALPLSALALAFARIATGVCLRPAQAQAARRLRQAIAAAPFMVGGSNRFDTRVMQRLGDRACVKTGAEGVYCAALPEQGIGVAIKIDDGNPRAAQLVMAAVIGAKVSLDDGERQFVHTLAAPALVNWRGIEVGALRASDTLRQALLEETKGRSRVSSLPLGGADAARRRPWGPQ